VLLLALLRIVNSPFGRVLQAIRENEFRAEAIGYRVVVYRTTSSVLSALFATLAGAMLALWLRYNGPDTSLSFEIMMDVLLIVVIGGMGTIYGAAIGAVLFLVAQSYLQDLLRLGSEAASPACRGCRPCCRPTAGCCGWACCLCCRSITSPPAWWGGCGNVSGYTADPMYDGAALAKTANAIVVTPNFRLGILGFMNLPQLKTGDASTDSGNFTMLDSIKALQFVRTNSSSFGGNPDNVTVVGQSAGAINVWALQTSPLMTAANPRAVPPRDALVGRHFAGDQPASRQPAHPEPGIGVPGPGQRAAAKPGDR
jgi:hypothetical protein